MLATEEFARKSTANKTAKKRMTHPCKTETRKGRPPRKNKGKITSDREGSATRPPMLDICLLIRRHQQLLVLILRRDNSSGSVFAQSSFFDGDHNQSVT